MDILTKTIIDIMCLTPVERWQSARNMGSSRPLIDNRFVIICLVILLVLVILLMVVNKYYREFSRKGRKDPFIEYGRQKGLSKGEVNIMRLVARSMPLADIHSIFAVPEIFNNGVQKIVNELISHNRNEEADQFKAELSYLREKLGFVKKLPKNSLDINQKDLSSRQIEEGTKITVTPRMTKDHVGEIPGEVVNNSFSGFVVKVSNQIEIEDSGLWYIRYYFGANVWEFDTTLIKVDGDRLVFSHSDEIRFVNRRRFLRVPVKMPGLIAKLSFSYKKSMDQGDEGPIGPIYDDIAEDAVSDYEGPIWGAPEFCPVSITELGGPGIRMTVPFEMYEGDRVLVIFRVKHIILQEDSEMDMEAEIVQDVGEVKNVRKVGEKFSVAVELTTTNEVHIAKLIQITNKVSVEQDAVSKMLDGHHTPATEPISV